MQSLQRFSLQGHTVLITGASSGIGYHLALGLAEVGAQIVACARRSDRLEELVEAIIATGSKAAAVTMDVTSGESIEHAFDEAEQLFGPIDILINNAGIADPKRFLDISEHDLDQLMNTNFRGAWLVAQSFSRRLASANKAGNIVNVASILGIGAHTGQASYSASKGAIVQMTRALANDLQRYNIRANAIAPGWFNTEMNAQFFSTKQGLAAIKQSPARRAGELDELIGPVLLLASEAGSFINGVILPVDGAHHTRLV